MSMLGTAEPHATSFDVRQLMASRWLWCLAAVFFIAGRDIAQSFGELLTSLGDTDDATRLYEIRQLMASGAWFDMSLPRIGGPAPLISHWSRLIDLPLVMLFDFFNLFLSASGAELLMRIVWPTIVLFIFLRLVVSAADRLRGGSAAALFLCCAITCMTGLFQFRIGRIDHHNAMIMGSIGGLLWLVNARLAPRDGLVAGVLIGIGLGVGYEPLAFLLPALAAVALLAVCDLAWLTGVRSMAVALATTLALIFLGTVAPSLWFVARCDALSLNMVVLAAAGAAGLVLVDFRGRDWMLWQRIATLAAAGAAGLIVYGLLDPRCLAGPFGQVEPALGPAWLNHVSEGLNVFSFLKLAPLSVVAYGGTIVVGLWAAIERARRVRSPESIALLTLLLISSPAGIWMIKLTPYASWIAMFCVALSLADLRPTVQLTALSRQLVGVLLASQFTVTVIAAQALTLAGTTAAALNGDIIDGTRCLTTPAIRSLAPLPKGFIVGSIDFGPYIVALTHHDVLAAPYHRIDTSILANQAILGAKPAEARKLLNNVHATYVVLCMPKADAADRPVAGQLETASGGIESLLKSNQTVSFLTPVPVESPVAELRVWRVER